MHNKFGVWEKCYSLRIANFKNSYYPKLNEFFRWKTDHAVNTFHVYLRQHFPSSSFTFERKGIIKNTFVLRASWSPPTGCYTFSFVMKISSPLSCSQRASVKNEGKKKLMSNSSRRQVTRKTFNVHKILRSFVMPTIFIFSLMLHRAQDSNHYHLQHQ